MKKIIALFAVTLLGAGLTHAEVNEFETSNIDVLRSQGYSESTLRIVDKVNYQNKYGKNYQKRFVEKNAKKSPYTYIKLYVDPTQDDGKFGEHQINFTNTWNGDETHYSSTKVDAAPVENL